MSSVLWCVVNGRAVLRLEHRRLDLEERAIAQKLPQRVEDRAPRHERLTHVGVGEQVDVALTISGLDIGQAVPFLGRRPQRLAE
jgi:hypothetical protein